MDVSGRFLAFTLHGAGWVLWLLVALSVVSLAIMLERLWFFRTHRASRRDLAADIRRLLLEGDERAGAAALAPSEIAAAIDGAKARERLRLERNLSFLATLGSNAPFVGLFGTVLGIIKAFHDLAAGQAGAVAGASSVMAGISEALVATAIGILVAIPAVVAFNTFSRRVKVRMAEVDWLAHLAAEDVQAAWAPADTGEDEPLRRTA
ncbi:MAG TPA: MotA/TolQ/ExbB proton channel family protein [Polyangia bacterium]|nr:MotA/TolQ/ExbB proton channel family protein [Polyangia bacterium]